jgi:predicted RNA-binding Zn ribbon-like protein
LLKSKRAFETEELSIRFVNTVAWRLREPSEERLKSPTALFEWLGQNDVAAPEVLHRLTRAEKTRSRDVRRVYEDAIQLRETIYALFVSRIRGQPPPAGALNLFSEFLWRGPSGLRLEWEKGRLTWRTRRVHDRALDLLRPIALSAADLLTGIRAPKMKQCQDHRGCGWLFLDESRLQNRRWCSMGDCGNIAKARRHRERVGRVHRTA